MRIVRPALTLSCDGGSTRRPSPSRTRGVLEQERRDLAGRTRRIEISDHSLDYSPEQQDLNSKRELCGIGDSGFVRQRRNEVADLLQLGDRVSEEHRSGSLLERDVG